MIVFDWKGARIAIGTELVRQRYRDFDGVQRFRLDRIVAVRVSFWDFLLEAGDLRELCFVKGACDYFMHAYWKRSTKAKSARIYLDLTLPHEAGYTEKLVLRMHAVEQNNQNYLNVFVTAGEDRERLESCYLSGLEVLALALALNKALALLLPTPPAA